MFSLKNKYLLSFSKHILLLFICSLFLSSSFAQKDKKTQLQNQFKQIQEEIKKIETLITNTQTEKKNSLVQLQSINTKINVREDLIGNINTQISYLKQSILEKQSVIDALGKDIDRLKEDYAFMVKNAYKNKYSSSPINFLFSADDFNQVIQRFTYLRSYASTRQNQSKLIIKTIEDLNSKIVQLEADKKDKESFLSEEEQQKNILEEEKNLKNELIIKLQDDEENLKKQIVEKNKAAKELNNQIQKIIEDEIKLAQEKAAKEAAANGTNVTVSKNGLALTPAEKQLSSDFVSNMGKLPWPVLKGLIIEKFGKHAHPTLKLVYTNNNGVDIRTEANSNVRAIFSGTVISSFYLPATQNSVIVKHGEYFTVYSNLKTVNVKAGEKLSTKQNIGVAFTQDNTTVIHLEIWKGKEKTNPEIWLAK